jgi:hypothetical protein
MTEKKDTTKTTRKKTSNFSNDFLKDFKLSGNYNNNNDWVYNKKALERFHEPVTYTDDHEDHNHYKLKSLIHDYIYENYYLENECKYLVTTELKQQNTTFYSYMGGKIPIFYTLDICVIRDSDYQVFDIEVDGPEHYSRGGLLKADIRDSCLLDRYGVLTLRIDKADVDCLNYKKIDKFISQPAVENPRRVRGKKKVT